MPPAWKAAVARLLDVHDRLAAAMPGMVDTLVEIAFSADDPRARSEARRLMVRFGWADGEDELARSVPSEIRARAEHRLRAHGKGPNDQP